MKIYRACKKCGIEKPHEDYTSNILSTKRGYVWCQSCNREYVRMYRKRATELGVVEPVKALPVKENKIKKADLMLTRDGKIKAPWNTLPVSESKSVLEKSITPEQRMKINMTALQLFPLIISKSKPSDSLFEIASDCLFVAELMLTNDETWIQEEEE